MAARTLTEQDLNRALLARQSLLERADLPLPRAIERVGGLQSQYAPSSYLGLWSRLNGFERDDLTDALERRTVIQGTLMRATIHMVTAHDYRGFVEGIRRSRRAVWLQAVRGRVAEKEIAAAVARARTLLEAGPRRRDEIVRELGVDSTVWNGVGLWVDLVRVPPSGTWEQRSANVYALAERWLPGSKAPAMSEDEGLELLARRYLGAFGPASRKDVASWSGVPAKTLDPVLERMTLRRFLDETGRELLDLPRAPLPDPETPAPIRFLPTWDATLLAHARRTQILPERYRPRVFDTKTPHSAPTFLVDGHVAGTWRHERGRVTLSPFERLSRQTRRELDEEAERLAAFMA